MPQRAFSATRAILILGLVMILVLIGILIMAAVGTARADAIDGHWCFSDGKRLFIEGSDIVTPGGARKTGEYDRHAFSYVIPPSEPGAGATVSMMQQDEELILVTVGDGPARPWRRCAAATS